MIVAVLICVISLALLLQFFVSYCRSVIAAGRKSELSEQVREIAGIQEQKVRGDEFVRLVQLLRLCPGRGDDGGEIRAVGIYYSLLDAVRTTFRLFSPSVARWTEVERENCSYFAAVVLDRRIAYSRELLAQQVSGSI
ncbi:MAG: hypothetical protein WA755_14075 [Candidatus Acidiferrales bacterium]